VLAATFSRSLTIFCESLQRGNFRFQLSANRSAALWSRDLADSGSLKLDELAHLIIVIGVGAEAQRFKVKVSLAGVDITP
jgi:hypothetical protein